MTAHERKPHQPQATDPVERARSLVAADATADRATLETYASWLFYERRILVHQLYPELGAAAESFRAEDNPGAHWHFVAYNHPRLAERMNPAGRAALVLAAVGVPLPEHPAIRKGQSHSDARLLETVSELVSAADAFDIAAGLSDEDLDTATERENTAIEALTAARPNTLEGLEAKAWAAQRVCRPDLMSSARAALSASLVEDMLRLLPVLKGETHA
jgi:hypothetical protein